MQSITTCIIEAVDNLKMAIQFPLQLIKPIIMSSFIQQLGNLLRSGSFEISTYMIGQVLLY